MGTNHDADATAHAVSGLHNNTAATHFQCFSTYFLPYHLSSKKKAGSFVMQKYNNTNGSNIVN